MRSDRMRRDLKRFEEVGEEAREDLKDFVQKGDLSDMLPDDKTISIPVKNIDLPEFQYMPPQEGQVGKAGEGDQPQPGDIDPKQVKPKPGEGEAGDEEGEHGHYDDLSSEEFADILEEELDLDLADKGKKVTEEKEGDWTKLGNEGTHLDEEETYKQALKDHFALYYDEEFAEEALKIEDISPAEVFQYLTKKKKANVSKRDLEIMAERIDEEEVGKYASFEELEEEVTYTPAHMKLPDQKIDIGEEHKRYRHPEIEEEESNNVVIVNIRDVSGSMGDRQRDLVERVFKTLDILIKHNYDHAEFVYITHDSTAEEEEDPKDFFTKKSGGGTKIASAYRKAKNIVEERYPWAEWNRYIFGAGDGDNRNAGNNRKVKDLMNETPVNLHGYLQVESAYGSGKFGEYLRDQKEEGNLEYDTGIADVKSQGEVLDGVKTILEAEGEINAG